MNNNIYPRNYFTPLEDLEQSSGETPGLAPEIKADLEELYKLKSRLSGIKGE